MIGALSGVPSRDRARRGLHRGVLLAGAAALLVLLSPSRPGHAAKPFVEAPYLSGPVVDEAKMLGPADRDQLERLLLELQSKGGVQMVIYLPESLRGLDIESFAMAIAEQWKLGRKGEDRGLLLVLAGRERRVRLEVGYGLEGEITDARSKRLLDDFLVPFLRAGRAADGLGAVVAEVGRIRGVELTGAPSYRSVPRMKARPLPWWVFLVFALLVFPAILVFLAEAGRRAVGHRGGGAFRRMGRHDGFHGYGGGGFRSGGGFGGGGFGGGGGGFGGGGASSGW